MLAKHGSLWTVLTLISRASALQRSLSPDVFASIVDRLCDFVVPYQHALETEAGKRNLHLYLAGLLSHLDRKNAEEIATESVTNYCATNQWC